MVNGIWFKYNKRNQGFKKVHLKYCTCEYHWQELLGKAAQFCFPKFKSNVETLQNVHECDIHLILLLTDNKFWTSKTWRTVQVIPRFRKLMRREPAAVQPPPRAPSSRAPTQVISLDPNSPNWQCLCISLQSYHSNSSINPLFSRYSKLVQSYSLLPGPRQISGCFC